MRKYLILIAMLVVVLSACRVESVVTLDIEADGSALVGAEIGFDEEFRQLLGDAGADPDDLFGDLPDFGGGDVEQTERTEGDMTFVGVAARVDDLSTFGTGGVANDVFTAFSYTYDEESATLDATVSSDTVGEAGGDLPIDPSQITDEFFRATVVVMMPGTVTQSNADEVRSDGALVWDLPITGGDVSIQATSDLGGGGTSNLLIIIVALVLGIAIIAIVAATIMNRRRSEQAVAAAAAARAATETNGDAAAEDAATTVDIDVEVVDEDDQPEST